MRCSYRESSSSKASIAPRWTSLARSWSLRVLSPGFSITSTATLQQERRQCHSLTHTLSLSRPTAKLGLAGGEFRGRFAGAACASSPACLIVPGVFLLRFARGVRFDHFHDVSGRQGKANLHHRAFLVQRHRLSPLYGI